MKKLPASTLVSRPVPCKQHCIGVSHTRAPMEAQGEGRAGRGRTMQASRAAPLRG